MPIYTSERVVYLLSYGFGCEFWVMIKREFEKRSVRRQCGNDSRHTMRTSVDIYPYLIYMDANGGDLWIGYYAKSAVEAAIYN